MSYHDNQLTSSAPNGRVKRASPQRLYILPIFCTHGAHHRMLLCIQSFKWFIDPLRKGKNLDILPKTEDFRLYVWYDFEYEFFNLFYTGGVRHSHIPSCQNIEVFNHCTTIIILQTVMFLMNSVLPSCLKEEKKHSMCLLHCSRLLQPMLLETWDSSCPSLNLLPYFPLWNQILNVYLKTHFALAPKFNPDLTTSQFKI